VTAAVKPPCDEGVILSAPEAISVTGDVGLWVLVATILGSSMVFIDGTAVNVALPALQTDLNATVASTQWVIEAYTLFLGALVLVGGALGDRYGRRRVFSIGVGLFAVASVWCGLAADVNQLIAARGAGRWGRAAGAGQPGDPQHLFQQRAARASNRHVVGLYVDNHSPWPRVGRAPGGARFLALGILDQSSACVGGHRDLSLANSGKPQRHSKPN
jgi:MFS family permease